MSSSTKSNEDASPKSFFGFMKGNVLVMITTNIFRTFSRSAVNPYFSLYVLALEGNTKSIGFINSLGPLASLLIFPLAGFITDRTGRVKPIIAAGYLSASIYLFYIFTHSWVMLAIGSFLLGTTVFQFPAQSALMADSLASRKRGIGYATSRAIPGAVAVLAPYFAGHLIDEMGTETGVRYLYALLLVTYFVTTTIRMRFLEETIERSESSPRFNLKELMKESYRSVIDVLKWSPTTLRAFVLVTAMCFMANAIAGPFWIVYAIQVIGLSKTQWGSLLFLYSALNIAVSIPAGAAIDRFGKRKTLVASFILSIVPLLFYTRSRGYTEILAILLMLSVTNALLPTACSALMADVVPREMRGKVMAAYGGGGIIINPIRGGGEGPGMGYTLVLPVMLGSLIGGYVYGVNPTHPWLLQLALTIGSLVLTLVFIREPKKAEV